MSVGYFLINQTRKEGVFFCHIPASTKPELAGNPVAAAITTWYLLDRRGECIAFVSDSDDFWPFASGSFSDLRDYRDCTEEIVAALIAAGILVDEGREVLDPDEADVFIRMLRNVWLEA